MTDYLDFTFDIDGPDIANVFDECSLWASKFGALMLEHAPLQRNIDILDVGCGTGFPLFEIAHTFGPSCRITGVDIWERAIERARWKKRVYDLPNVEVVLADAAHMPFGDAAFDLIVSNVGVNNFADPVAAFAECSRVVKPGGTIALTTNLTGHMGEFYTVFRAVVAELNKPEYMERLRQQEEHRGTIESVSAFLRNAGFGVVKTIEDSFTMRYTDGGALMRHSLTKLGFLDGWKSVVDKEDQPAVFAELERRLDIRASEPGELRMTVPMLYLQGVKHPQ